MNDQKSWQLGGCLLIALACVFFAASAGAEGFRNPPAGAFNLGRAGGRVAQVDDASTAGQNPANMPDLTNIEAQISPSIVYIKVNYASSFAPGQTAETQSPWKLLPNLFAVVPFWDGKAAAGLSVTVPYGLSMEWNQNSSAFSAPTPSWKYFSAGGTPYFASLTTANINPAVAVKLGDHFSVGAGLDVMWSSLQFKTYLFPGDPADAYGTGTGVGGNVAFTWRITDRQRLALTYRSPMTVNYYGTFSQVPFAPGFPAKSPFRSEIRYPTIVSAGYGIELPHNIRLESDVEWLEFSRFSNLAVVFSGMNDSLPEDWHNTFTAGIAGDWSFAKHWVVRAGYQFYESPVPDHTFSPLIPDANQNVMTIGLAWKGKHNSFEAAYGLDLYDTRNISNNQFQTFDGKYTFSVHLFSLAYSYTF